MPNSIPQILLLATNPLIVVARSRSQFAKITLNRRARDHNTVLDEQLLKNNCRFFFALG